MLDEKEVQHIADLARIKMNESEKKKFKKEISSILEYAHKLNEANTDSTEPLYQASGIVNALREDAYRADFEMDEQLNERLIEQAPRKQERFIKVKSVFKK